MQEEGSTLTRCTERVTCSELPHAREELAEAADEKRHTNNNVRYGHTIRLNIDQGK